MSSILVVCTGNICRSPVAEGLLRHLLQARFGDAAPAVSSAGVAGWEDSPPVPESVQTALEREVDISSHRARRLAPEHIEEANLVVAMTAEQRDAVAQLMPASASRTFTLKELVRLLEALPRAPSAAKPNDEGFVERVADADRLRRDGFEGNPADEDVSDPLGMPIDFHRAVAWELDDLAGRLVEGLFGRAPVRAFTWDADE